jgi:hypothetical protein
MPENDRSTSPRAIGILFAITVLIVFAGLAGLGATAISDGAPGKSPSMQTGLHPARIKDKYGYADSAGRMVIGPRFDLADTFSDGLALVGEGGRFGYIDGKGAFAIPAVFSHALPFRDGFATVRSREGWISIDHAGHPAPGREAAAATLAEDGDNPR